MNTEDQKLGAPTSDILPKGTSFAGGRFLIQQRLTNGKYEDVVVKSWDKSMSLRVAWAYVRVRVVEMTTNAKLDGK
jgi:hypothetical protein